MKFLLFGLFTYVAGFATAYFWEADRERRISEDAAFAKRRWEKDAAEVEKDDALLKKIDGEKEKILTALGFPPDDPLGLGPSPTPTATQK
jgi:hypothetical protein